MTPEIRLLSLWQPWASLIAMGLKQYETRSWSTSYRRTIAIHAAQRKAKDDELAAIYASIRRFGGTAQDIARLDGALGEFLTWKDALPYGAIVAVADLTDCRMMDSKYSTISGILYPYVGDQSPLELAVGLWQPGRFAWKLENLRPIAHPIPCKGHQGLRRIQDAKLLEAIGLPLRDSAVALEAIESRLALTDQIEQQLTATKGGES